MTPIATLARGSTQQLSAIDSAPPLDAKNLESFIAPLEPQMLAILDEEIVRAQQERRKPDLPSRKESLLINAKAGSLSPILRLKSLRRHCESRVDELRLSPEILALL
jgi:hypothetical protein